MQILFDELEPRLLSPKLWKGFAPPIGGVFPGTASGNPVIGLFDDFTGWGVTCPLATTLTHSQSNGISYLHYNDTTVVPHAAAIPTTTPSVDENGPGVIILKADTTANDSATIMAGSGTMVPFHAIPTRMQELVFECRFKVSSIAGASTDLFIGLGGTGACADSGVQTDASAGLASNNFLGFVRKAAATSALTFTYQRVGGTEGTKAGVATLVADTYIKVGFRYHAARKQCSIWANGEEVTAARVTAAQTAATPWPTLYMNFLAEMKYLATSSHELSIDWWACAQQL